MLVEQAYAREGDAIRSVKVLAAGDKEATADIETIATVFVDAGKPADLKRLDALGSQDVHLTAMETEASKLIAPPQAGGAARCAEAFCSDRCDRQRSSRVRRWSPVDSRYSGRGHRGVRPAGHRQVHRFFQRAGEIGRI